MTTTPPAPTLTAHTDADPCPRVEVLITPMPAGVDEITIYRSWSGQRSTVRGASRTEVSGDHLVIDYEVPLGASVQYSAVAYDAAGVPSEESSPSSTTVSVTDLWLQDPLDPTSALQVGMNTPRDLTVFGPSFMPAEYSVAASLTQIVGDRFPVALGGIRQAASAMPLRIDAANQAAATALIELLQQSFPLCVRTPATLVPQLTGLTYLAIQTFRPQPYERWTRTLIDMEGAEVRSPGAGVVVQPRTYDDLLDEAATYTALLALYPSYIALLRGS